jgi:tRNA-2-methylthio-N6-dimethylallyladenosine synthase
MNVRNSSRPIPLLTASGHAIIISEEIANLDLLNACSVREQAQMKVMGKSRHYSHRTFHRIGILLGIVGCMADNLVENLLALNSGIDFAVRNCQKSYRRRRRSSA